MTADRQDVIANWVGDYCTSSAFLDHPSLVREYAPDVLTTFLEGACAQRGVMPADVEEADLKPALLEHVARLEIAGSAREGVPALCAAFLAEMQAQGRLGGGRTLGLYVRALRGPFVDAAAGKGQTLRAPGAKLGRNDPCPCGSGKKYKKCCRGMLD
ncbi:MAG: SEC-C metal-binding domain-containing protein [Planctomycetota bacterium]|nr:SEC-C metal-binding domain-containing protein [Planctomycetota bacterium]